MNRNRDQAARELLAFYQEAGVDALVGETPVDRFADAPPKTAPAPPEAAPAEGRPGQPRAIGSPAGSRAGGPRRPRASAIA